MGIRYILSDLHLGHKNISKFRKGSSSEEQNEQVYENLASMVDKRDTLFLLGDVAFDNEWLSRIKNLPCRDVRLILGNHDTDNVSIHDIVKTYSKVLSLQKYKKHWLTHAPVHPLELRGVKCLHGHTHYQLMIDEEGIPDNRYINVCCEYTRNKPITWEYATSEEYQQECTRLWLTEYEGIQRGR